MRKALLVTAAAALALGLAAPASAGDTPTTFTLTSAGLLTISAPATTDLGSFDLAGNVEKQLGTVTVQDNRGQLLGSWTATVSASDFVTDHTDPDTLAQRTIENDLVSYDAGLVTPDGVGVFVPGATGNLADSRTAATATGVVGRATASWNPTISVAVPSDAPKGTYAGMVTHSVA